MDDLDVKPDNVLVNLQEGDMRFSDVQLGDLGGCYPIDSEWATSGTVVGAPMWTSPEILMELPWNTAAEIWSFGALVRRNSTAACVQMEANVFIAHKPYLRWPLQPIPTQRFET
jgi:serine/threonine protein kinase